MQDSNDQQVLCDVLDQLKDEAGAGTVSVDDVVSTFERRSFGALLTVIGVVAAFPIIGSIPGVSILTGSLAILVAGQYLLDRNQPWIPDGLRQREIDSSTMTQAIEKMRPVAKWVDYFVRPRLGWLVRGPVASRLAAITVCLLAATMIPLALIPWGVQPPATAILLFGVATLGRDGAFALAGYALAASTIVVLYYSLSTIQSVWTGLIGG